MGLTRGKVLAIIGAIVIAVILLVVGLLGSKEDTDADDGDTGTGGGSIVTADPEPTVTPETEKPTDEPTSDPEPTPDDADAKESLEELSLEGKGFKQFESLPVEKIYAIDDMAADGILAYFTYDEGETIKKRQKKIKKYIHSQSNLLTEDLMATGLVEAAGAVINSVEINGANGESAVYHVSMDTSLQLAPATEGNLSSISTSRNLYYVLVEKTDEGWKITDITEKG